MARDDGFSEQTEDTSTPTGCLPGRTALGKSSAESNEVCSKNRGGVYRYAMMALWLGSSLVMILDRFYWNVWPRQTICSPGCGNDSFCDMDEDPGCLKPGPWSVKLFDAIARISARLIISTTTLLFSTMCHGTWNYLSEVAVLRPFLYAWRGDNAWLHSVGGWTIGVWIMLHVWSLFFPSIFHGFSNVNARGRFEWFPTQVAMSGGNVDVGGKLARWGYDDIWRIVWMTAIFGFLMPLSRSTWAMRKNFSFAMGLHAALGAGVFYDSWRRKTHPHVWILNTPVVIWYIADKILCATRNRVDPMAHATRVALDDDYMLLLWKHDDDEPKRICDIFWLKHSHSHGKGKGTCMAGELAHPFTTCSSHDVAIHDTPLTNPLQGNAQTNQVARRARRPLIDIPAKTDVSWPGHRFTLRSALSAMSRVSSSGQGVSPRDPSTASLWSGFDLCGSEQYSSSRRPNTPSVSSMPSMMSCESHVPALAELGCFRAAGKSKLMTVTDEDGVHALRTPGVHGVWPVPVTPEAKSGDAAFFQTTPAHGFRPRHLRRASERVSRVEEGKSCFEEEKEEEDTMVGVDTGCRPNDVTVFLGGVKSCTTDTARRIRVGSSVNNLAPSSNGELDSHRDYNGNDATGAPRPTPDPASQQGSNKPPQKQCWPAKDPAANLGPGHALDGQNKARKGKRMGLKRLNTTVFEEFRSKQAEEGRVGHVGGNTWNKMAIVKIHRREKEPTVRSCSCLGITAVVSWFRQPQTASIADFEVAGEESGSVPLRTYGAYRSEYGRLGEFPNLPPLLVIATGAGAALALDFVAYVRANRLVPRRPVKVCYSSASLALLQFVTNTLLAESTPGIHIKTALTRHDDLQVFDTTAESEEHLAIGRLDVRAIIDGASSDTEVYFCGGGTINAMLRAECIKRGMKYAGSSVQ